MPINNSPQNYNELSTINNLPALAEVIEKVVYRDLYDCVVNNKIIPDNQDSEKCLALRPP